MMTQKFTGEFFKPESVVIIGASEETGKIGSGLYKSIAQDFQGDIFLVNPKYQQLWNKVCYASVLDLPKVPTHAIIALSRSIVLPTLEQCVEKGIRNVTVVSSGFKELDAHGAFLETKLQEICQQNHITLLGPNTLGFINTADGFNGTFLPNRFEPGTISVISQSGGVGMALLAALQDQRSGIAKWIGIGNEAVLDAVELLDYFERDPATRVIAVCFEGLKDLPGFLQRAAQVNRTKPVVILRDGKSLVGIEAAASHTGRMAQPDQVMAALIRQHGLIEAQSCRECAVILKALSIAPAVTGKRTVILTNTAGPAILAADILQPAGILLPQPSLELRQALDAETGTTMQLKNPADISSNGLSPEIYGMAARGLLGSAEYDLLLSFFSLNPHLALPDRQIGEVAKITGKPVIACFLSSLEEFLAYDLGLEQFGVPCYYDPQDAAIAAKALITYGSIRSTELPPVHSTLTELAKSSIAAILKTAELQTAAILPERTSRQLLWSAGIDNFIPQLIRDPDDAVHVAEAIGYPVALKIHSDRITHKTDAGGVRLNLTDEAEVRTAYREMMDGLIKLDPTVRLTLQPMEAAGFELIIGGVRKAGLGNIVMAGTGGIYSEIFNDAEFRLTPLRQGDAQSMLEQLKSAPILSGYRKAGLDKPAVARTIEVIAELLETFPQIEEIEINPCRVYQTGIAILDARIILRP